MKLLEIKTYPYADELFYTNFALVFFFRNSNLIFRFNIRLLSRLIEYDRIKNTFWVK